MFLACASAWLRSLFHPYINLLSTQWLSLISLSLPFCRPIAVTDLRVICFMKIRGFFFSLRLLTKNVMTKGRRTFICKWPFKSLWQRGDLWPLELPGIWLKSRGRWKVLKTITSKGLIISWPSFSSSAASINPSESITTRPTQFRSVS